MLQVTLASPFTLSASADAVFKGKLIKNWTDFDSYTKTTRQTMTFIASNVYVKCVIIFVDVL